MKERQQRIPAVLGCGILCVVTEESLCYTGNSHSNSEFYERRVAGYEWMQQDEAHKTMAERLGKMREYGGKRGRRKKRLIRVVAVFGAIIVIGVALLAALLVEHYKPSNERVDLMAYFGVGNEEDVAVMLQNELQEMFGKYSEDGNIYLPYSVIKQLNHRFYWDESAQTMVYTTPSEIYKMPLNQSEYTCNGESMSVERAPVIQIEDEIYMELEFAKQYSNFYYESYENPQRVNIFYRWEDVSVIKVKKDGVIRELGGFKSPIVTDVKAEDELYFLYSMDEWSCVQTKDGLTGYIENKNLSGDSYIISLTNQEYIEPDYTNLVRDHKINLAFHQIDRRVVGGELLRSEMEGVTGVNVVAPTWFYLSDNDGNLESYASKDYVDAAHAMGLEVWGLVENMAYGEKTSTTQVVSQMASRENLIQQLIQNALDYGLDGINVDFEMLSGNGEEGFIEFIRELSVHCRANNLVLSIDNYVPTASSSHYNRKEQGIVADYVIIMGYDEHYGGSEEAGSTASIGFVKDGIENTLLEVPPEKVINAIPFYTRVFMQTPEEAATEESEGILIEDPNSEYGRYLLSSVAVSMGRAQELLSSHGITPIWLDSVGQYYGEYEDGGRKYLVWLEEERSIGLKMQLIKDYKLGGVAEWSLGLAQNEIWEVIYSYLQE